MGLGIAIDIISELADVIGVSDDRFEPLLPPQPSLLMFMFSVDRGGDGGGDTAVAEEGPAEVSALVTCIRPRLGGE